MGHEYMEMKNTEVLRILFRCLLSIFQFFTTNTTVDGSDVFAYSIFLRVVTSIRVLLSQLRLFDAEFSDASSMQY